ncbi:MAG: KUP/HAK/KT family potassium transporter [Acidobacteriales bacterium]|nr:KUP/HAK/KT family potassium transporter [Terriglobales bacterium]
MPVHQITVGNLATLSPELRSALEPYLPRSRRSAFKSTAPTSVSSAWLRNAIRSLWRMAHCITTRVPGTAVFFASSLDHVPPILVHFVQRCRSLHQNVILLTVVTQACAKTAAGERWQVQQLGDGFWRVLLHFGFMEHPRVGEALGSAVQSGQLPVNLEELTYYVGHETLTAQDSTMTGRVAEKIFAYLQRNAIDVESTFCLPPGQVIEIGTQIDL